MAFFFGFSFKSPVKSKRSDSQYHWCCCSCTFMVDRLHCVQKSEKRRELREKHRADKNGLQI